MYSFYRYKLSASRHEMFTIRLALSSPFIIHIVN